MRTAIPRFDTAPIARTFDAWRRIGGRAATWLKASSAAWAQTRRHHREVALLQTFDERMLRDVGLTRADVQGAASTPWWRDPAAILRGRAGPRGHNRRPTPVPPAPSIVPGLPGGARDLADRPSPETPALPALRCAGRKS
jgi:uncharacterized protein YjiS (DUF1127 family)